MNIKKITAILVTIALSTITLMVFLTYMVSVPASAVSVQTTFRDNCGLEYYEINNGTLAVSCPRDNMDKLGNIEIPAEVNGKK